MFGVHIHRWDSLFGVWDHEASFRLHWRAQAAAKALALPTIHTQNLYRVTDTRDGARLTWFYHDGEEILLSDLIGQQDEFNITREALRLEGDAA